MQPVLATIWSVVLELVIARVGARQTGHCGQFPSRFFAEWSSTEQQLRLETGFCEQQDSGHFATFPIAAAKQLA